jgi:xanthine dehydrogenase YagR molybdenum-binding subunit
LAKFTIHVDQQYNIKADVHNPMEMHATIAHWTGNDTLKLYDKNQGVNNVQRTFARLFSIPEKIYRYSVNL